MLRTARIEFLFLLPEECRDVKIFSIDDGRICLGETAFTRGRLKLQHFLLLARFLGRLRWLKSFLGHRRRLRRWKNWTAGFAIVRAASLNLARIAGANHRRQLDFLRAFRHSFHMRSFGSINRTRSVSIVVFCGIFARDGPSQLAFAIISILDSSGNGIAKVFVIVIVIVIVVCVCVCY